MADSAKAAAIMLFEKIELLLILPPLLKRLVYSIMIYGLQSETE